MESKSRLVFLSEEYHSGFGAYSAWTTGKTQQRLALYMPCLSDRAGGRAGEVVILRSGLGSVGSKHLGAQAFAAEKSHVLSPLAMSSCRCGCPLLRSPGWTPTGSKSP